MSTKTLNTKVLHFKNTLHEEFNQILNKRVNSYFKINKKHKHANSEMIIKTIFMFSLYFVPYFLFIFGIVQNIWIYYLMMVFMGFGKSGIGMSVMHDALHGGYSKNKLVNTVLGYSLNLIGANATNWKIQHNIKHHTYTNISGMDEDIRQDGILRFNPYESRKKIHKWQYIYAWFLFPMMTLSWITTKDYFQFFKYKKEGILQTQTSSIVKSGIWLIFTKLFYNSYMIVLPLIFTPFLWYQVIIGFLIMHFVAGFILSAIFQPAHVMEINDFEDGDKLGTTIEENWAVHQMKTTCNFAQKNKPFSWFVGGLNYQIEHHLYPNICHVHYRKIAKIVKDTAKEYNIPYKSYPTFMSALYSHGKMLHRLGKVNY